MTYKPDYLIYHADCDDGFGAAWAAWLKWGDDVTYIPMKHGQQLPPVAGQVFPLNILIADFSLPAETVEALVAMNHRVLTLDHHKTAAEALRGIRSVTRPTIHNVEDLFDAVGGEGWACALAEFDMDRSGARMVWDFVWPHKAAPELILTVEDRDLWRFDRVATKMISRYLQSIDRTFEAWTRVSDRLQHSRATLMDEARAVNRYHDRIVSSITSMARREQFAGHSGVPVVRCCPYGFVSDVGHALLAARPDAPFAVIEVRSAAGFSYSLRSTDDRVDVSEIAVANGGGGHRNAAGFSSKEPVR